MPSLAIVGAGAAGATAAYALRDSPVSVTVFEKSSGVCGRAATRRRGDCTYDHGANYVKSDHERVARLLTEELDSEGLVDIDRPVWTFDEAGTISEGHGEDGHKWTYRGGITQLAKRLLSAADATVHRETRIETLDRTGDGWRLVDDAGSRRGRFDGLLLTPPAPQTADLLGAANWEHHDRRRIREAIAVVPYRTIVSAVLHYPFEIDRPYYALVNTDREHAIGWLSREECKSGHVPDGESLLIVQLSPAWSVDRYAAADAELLDEATDLAAELLDDDRLSSPDWTDIQRWRYALPDASVDQSTLDLAVEHDLFLAGDWIAGEGRVGQAVESGFEAADRVREQLRE